MDRAGRRVRCAIHPTAHAALSAKYINFSVIRVVSLSIHTLGECRAKPGGTLFVDNIGLKNPSVGTVAARLGNIPILYSVNSRYESASLSTGQSSHLRTELLHRSRRKHQRGADEPDVLAANLLVGDVSRNLQRRDRVCPGQRSLVSGELLHLHQRDDWQRAIDDIFFLDAARH